MSDETSTAAPGVVWQAADDPHPARLASQRSYAAVAAGDLQRWLSVYAEDAVLRDPVGPSMFDAEGRGHHGHAGLTAFWHAAIAPVHRFEFTVTASYANPGSVTCANVGRIRTAFADGSHTTTELVMVYVVGEDGRVVSMNAYWEPERTIASFTAAPG